MAPVIEHLQILFCTRGSASRPFFAASRRHGVAMYSVYNNQRVAADADDVRAALFNGIHRLQNLAWLTTTVRREFGLTASRRRNYDG